MNPSHCPLISQPSIPVYGLGTAIKPVKVFFQYQPMHSDAEFDEKADFAIKRVLAPWFDKLADGQSQNKINWRTNSILGKERVNRRPVKVAYMQPSKYKRFFGPVTYTLTQWQCTNRRRQRSHVWRLLFSSPPLPFIMIVSETLDGAPLLLCVDSMHALGTWLLVSTS